MTFFNNVKIKAGFDQTLTDAENIESFTPNTGSPQQFKAGRGGMVYFAVAERDYSEGQERLDPDGGSSFAGFKQVRYIQHGCHPDAYDWLVTNYRGQVTCSVPLYGTTYTTWNALLRFTKEPSDERDGWYKVTYIFTLVEAVV